MQWRLLMLKGDVSTLLTGNVGAIIVDVSAEVLWKHALYINDMNQTIVFQKGFKSLISAYLNTRRIFILRLEIHSTLHQNL